MTSNEIDKKFWLIWKKDGHNKLNMTKTKAKKHGWKTMAENLGQKAWVKCMAPDCLCQPYPPDTAKISQIEYLKSRRHSQ